MSEKQLTEGQKRTRLGFNPSGLKRVHNFKSMIADAIDYLSGMERYIKKEAQDESFEDVGDFLRETATAKTSLHQASQMGVGAMTLPLAFKYLGDTQVDAPLEIVSGKATKKPINVDVITFEDFVEFGRKNAGSLVNGQPLSFTYKEHPITQENENLYLISSKEGIMNFTPDDVLITDISGEIYPCKRDIFSATYTW